MKLKYSDPNQSRNERMKRNKIWHSIVEVYREFAKESSIHGIKYTVQAKSTTERLLWLIIVIISLVCSAQLANKFYEKHKSASMRTIIVTNQFPAVKLPLPAVTICLGYLVSTARLKSFLTKQNQLNLPNGLTINDFEQGLRYLREVVYPTNKYSHALDKLQLILNANRMSILQLLEQVSPNCSDIFITCMYEGRNESCTKLFTPIVTTTGICCSFNSAVGRRYWSKKSNSSSIQREYRDLHSQRYGSIYILSMLLKGYNDTDRIAATTFGKGYSFMLHDSYAYPGPNGIQYKTENGYETIAALRGSYIISTPEVLSLSSRLRDCRISTKEMIYRAENCFVECRNAMIQEKCNCTPFHSENISSSESTCNLTNISCLSRIIYDVFSLAFRDPRCDCLPNCERITYTRSIISEPADATQFKPGTLYRERLEYPNSSLVHLTFASKTSVLMCRELVLTWISLMSSLGGVFSLFLGCSFISVIEFFYFFIFQLIKTLLMKYKSDSRVMNLNFSRASHNFK